MVVVLDTRQMGPNRRAQAMSAFLDAQTATPMAFRPGSSSADAPLALSAAVSSLGAVQSLRVGGSAIRASRGQRQLAASAEPLISVVQVRQGVIVVRRGTEAASAVAKSGQVVLLDLTEPVRVDCSDGFETFALQTTHSQLGLSDRAIRSAACESHASTAMSALLGRHMTRLCTTTPAEVSTAIGQILGETTIDLVRSLVAQLAATGAELDDIREQTLTTRIEQYILARLGDPQLSPAAIARAHFISLRRLYYAWSDHDESLTEWIIARRLKAARRMLADDANQPVSEISRRCGFVNAAHFSRRYRQRFGLTPDASRRQQSLSTGADASSRLPNLPHDVDP